MSQDSVERLLGRLITDAGGEMIILVSGDALGTH